MKKYLSLLLCVLFLSSCTSSGMESRNEELESRNAELEYLNQSYKERIVQLDKESSGVSSSQLQDLQSQLDSVNEENETYKKQIAKLQSDLAAALYAASGQSPTHWEQKALETALNWLEKTPDSPSGVEDILRIDGFQITEINYVLTHPDIDWNVVATDLVNQFYSDLDRDSILWMLEFEGFTSEQAVYAADNYTKTSKKTTSDHEPTIGEKNALKKAGQYLDYSAFSEEGLTEQLEYEGFTSSEVKYAVENCGADWYDQAAKKAEQYLDYGAFSKERLIEQLEYEGFSYSQALHGAEAVGY